MFGKKKTQNLAGTEPKPTIEPYEIHVMPSKFQKIKKVGSGGLGRIIIIGLVVFAFVLAAGAASYYFFVILQNQSLPSAKNVVSANLNINLNSNINANKNANQSVGLGNENLNFNVNVAENVNVNQNTNAILNTNSSAQGAVNYSNSADADKDGLTDIEEDLYGANKNLPDSDSDGFLDGVETQNLYDPTRGSSALLVNSGYVNVYANPVFYYQVFYPSKWLAKPTDQSLTEVVFQSSTEEFVSLSVQDNEEKMALVDWYVLQSPGADLNGFQKIKTKNGMEVLLTPDKLTAYLYSEKTADKIYVLNYNIGALSQINFATTFSMMINSFQIVPKL